MSFGSLYAVRQERLRHEQEGQTAILPIRAPVSRRATVPCERGHTWRDAKNRCVLCKSVEVEADQLYRNFAYTFKPGDRKEIHSKRQFLRECRRTGQRLVAADDLLKRGVPYKPDPTVSGLKPEMIAQTIREVQRSATPARVERAWHDRKQQKEA